MAQEAVTQEAAMAQEAVTQEAVTPGGGHGAARRRRPWRRRLS